MYNYIYTGIYMYNIVQGVRQNGKKNHQPAYKKKKKSHAFNRVHVTEIALMFCASRWFYYIPRYINIHIHIPKYIYTCTIKVLSLQGDELMTNNALYN